MTAHEPTVMVYDGQHNQTHKHNTRHGVRYRNHWYASYKCPVCGAVASHRKLPIVCTGDSITPRRRKR
jgi:hypothetical protein